MLVLLNPFMLWVYLHDMLGQLPIATARRVVARGAAVAMVVFAGFAWTGDALFVHVLQVRFASFLLFGGVIFLIIAVRVVLVGSRAKTELVGGAPQHIAGSIAMPFMIGPGTVSVSVLAGESAGPVVATAAIGTAVAITVSIVLFLEGLLRRVAVRYRGFVERYTDIVGRVSALAMGTIALEMILRGIEQSGLR